MHQAVFKNEGGKKSAWKYNRKNIKGAKWR